MGISPAILFPCSRTPSLRRIYGHQRAHDARVDSSLDGSG